jgi:hypothetical protein
MNPLLPLDRRQFLRSGLRYALLAGLGGLVVAEQAKRERLKHDPNCVRIWTCNDCVEYGGCQKPKVLNFRQAQAGERQGLPPSKTI